MSEVVKGFFYSRGFKHFRTVRPDPRLGEIQIYQRSDFERDVLYTGSFLGEVVFLGASRYRSIAAVNLDVPCPAPRTERQVQDAVLEVIKKREKEIAEATPDEIALLIACEAVVSE